MATGEEVQSDQSATDFLFGKGSDVLDGVINYFKAAGNASLQERVAESQVKQNQLYYTTELQYQNRGGALAVGGNVQQTLSAVPGWVWGAGALGIGLVVVLLIKK